MTGGDAEGNRHQATVFGEVAELYDRARLGYPDALVDDVLTLLGCDSPRLFEIGAGTGKATALFASRGLEVVAVEPSAAMAAVAKRNCLRFPRVSIEVSSFEGWPEASGAFDLVFSAQAWHWTAPQVRYAKAHALLRSSGGLAVFFNRTVWEDDSLRAALEDVYERRAPELRAASPEFTGLRQSTAFDERMAAEIPGSGFFGPLDQRSYRWSKPYTPDEYLELLQTQSGHRMLPERERMHLLAGVAEVIEEARQSLVMNYVTKLYLSRKLG